MSITKEQFISAIEAIKKYSDWSYRLYEFFGQYPDDTPADSLMNNYLELLSEATNDVNNGWIFYFCWELEFGRDWDFNKHKVLDADNNPIELKTAEDLWNLLQKENLSYSPIATNEYRIIIE